MSAKALHEKVVELLNETGVRNTLYVANIINLKNPEKKEEQLEKLYNVLKQYKKVVDELRKMPYILMVKEPTKFAKLLLTANTIRKNQILPLVQSF